MTEMMQSTAISGALALLDPVPAEIAVPESFSGMEGATRYEYRDAEGGLRLIVLRRDWTEAGVARKTFRPVTAWRTSEGEVCWLARSLPPEMAAPLYGAEVLAARPEAPVMVVEGEQCADAVAGCFADHVAVAVLGGSSRAGRADVSALADRDVILAGDADAPGQKAVETLTERLLEIGVTRLRVLNIASLGAAVSGEVPRGYDIADAIADGLTPEMFWDLAAASPDFLEDVAQAGEPENMDAPEAVRDNAVLADLWREFGMVAALPPGLEISQAGVVKHEMDARGNLRTIHVCSPVAVLCYSHSGSAGAGALVAVQTRRKTWSLLNVPWSLLAGDGREVRELVAREGGILAMDRAGRTAFAELLSHSASETFVTVQSQPGWTEEGHFLTPTATVRSAAGGGALLDLAGRSHDFGMSGSLEGWQQAAALAVGNPIMAFGLMMGFAGPLGGLLQIEAPGFHLYGESSRGKTSILAGASSVWGPPKRFIKSWRATTNSIEATAADRNDTLLVLDEIHLSDPSETASAVYTIANGSGRGRAGKTGLAQATRNWSTSLLSAGERSFQAHLAQARGPKLSGGLSVRLIDLPLGPDRHGAIATLHGHATPRALVETFAGVIEAHHGWAGTASARALAADPAGMCRTARAYMKAFTDEVLWSSEEPQLERVAKKFALVYAAGRLAVDAGILPWPAETALEAATSCFYDWLQDRGSPSHSQDELSALCALKEFFELHGPTRFQEITDATDPDGQESGPKLVDGLGFPPRERCGYRSFKDGAPVYYVLAGAWRSTVCAGQDPLLAARAAERCGALTRGEANHMAQKKRLPDYPGGTRVYVIRPDLLP